MGMFLNYDSIEDNYVPNNLKRAFPTERIVDNKLLVKEASIPYELTNKLGETEGYFWNYGETVNLEFTLDGEITVEDDALISSSVGVSPDTDTRGTIGQRFYNVVDLKSYTLVSIVGEDYLWEIDEEFTYPTNAGKKIYMDASDYLSTKKVSLTIYNFRYEELYTKTFNAESRIIFEIDKKMSEEMVRGVYYCSLKVFDDSTSTTVFLPTDCKLLVK